MSRILPLVLSSCCVWLFCGCDNVARAFDPNVQPPEPPPGSTTSVIQQVPAGGDTRDGRPKVKAVFPTGGGWPSAVPIVVEFSESINVDSVLPTSATATDARVVVRVKGATQVLPAAYNFVAADRVLVIRPSAGLSNQANQTYEIVLLPDGRDVDGVRFQVPTAGQVLGEFQANQAETIVNGRILTTFPRDNSRDVTRETDYYVFFDRPPNPASITAANPLLRQAGGNSVPRTRSHPLQVLGNDDPRVLRILPNDPLLAQTDYELVVDDTITFGANGRLDFRGRTPFARFRTVGPAAPTAMHVENPTPGFPDKVNLDVFTRLMLSVTTPSDTQVGDRVVARIYGGDKTTTAVGDLVFLERFVDVAQAGTSTVRLDYVGALGTRERPKFDEGDLTFCVQLQRGSEHSGYATSDPDDPPRLDLTPPEMSEVGPPGAGNDIFTDQESLVFYGKASERLADVSLVSGLLQTTLFAGSQDGRFVTGPIRLGRFTGAFGYSLNLTDAAGNLAAAPSGNIVQRGVVTGMFGGELTVEAYDATTLLPVADATVLVDSDDPTVPATIQSSMTTMANGRATFPGLGGLHRTITIVRAGYDLITLYATTAAFVSLPLRPETNATATLTGTLVSQAAGGSAVLIGNNTFDDPMVYAVRAAAGTPTVIPANTLIQPNRPQVITAFGGTFEPTGMTDYTSQGFQMLGPTLLVPQPPGAPAAPGATSTQSVNLLPVAANLVQTFMPNLAKDFSLAAGLDTSRLEGGRPFVRSLVTLEGFGGQVLAGVGHATFVPQSVSMWSWGGTVGLPLVTGLARFMPIVWGAIEARDLDGRISRVRGRFDAPSFQDSLLAPSVPPLTVPPPQPGSPLCSYEDTMAAAPNVNLALVEVVARDASGRRWMLLRTDNDPIGGTKSVQFPDLTATQGAGLAAGNWDMRIETRTFLQLANGATENDFVLADRHRTELTCARSATVVFTKQ